MNEYEVASFKRLIKIKYTPAFKLDCQQYNCENHIKCHLVFFADKHADR